MSLDLFLVGVALLLLPQYANAGVLMVRVSNVFGAQRCWIAVEHSIFSVALLSGVALWFGAGTASGLFSF